MDIDRGISERDGLWSPGLRRERTAAIRRNRGQEVVYGSWFSVASQMKEDRVGGCGGQMALPNSQRVNSGLWRVIFRNGYTYGFYGRNNPVFRGKTRFSRVGELVESTVQLVGTVQLRNEFGKGGEISLKIGRVNDCAMLQSAT